MISRKRVRSVLVGALVAVGGAALLTMCFLSIVFYGWAWSQGFQHAGGPWQAILGALLLAAANTAYLGYYSVLPLLLVGGLVGYLRSNMEN